MDLCFVANVSPVMISLTECHYSMPNSFEENSSLLLFETVIAAKFCSCCNVNCLDSPQLPCTKRQHREGALITSL